MSYPSKEYITKTTMIIIISCSVLGALFSLIDIGMKALINLI